MHNCCGCVGYGGSQSWCVVSPYGALVVKPTSVWDACENVASAYNTAYVYDMSTRVWCIKLACFGWRDTQSLGSTYI